MLLLLQDFAELSHREVVFCAAFTKPGSPHLLQLFSTLLLVPHKGPPESKVHTVVGNHFATHGTSVYTLLYVFARPVGPLCISLIGSILCGPRGAALSARDWQ